MLATRRQIDYLQHLTDRADYLKWRHPSLIPAGLYHQKWDIGMTSERASLMIEFYRNIVESANKKLYRK